MPSAIAPVSFSDAAGFRAWLQANHDRAGELVVRLFKKDSGHPSLSYPEALDEALCFGWIDGLRKNYDAASYTIRFTPRKPKSIWSLVNVRHAERLIRSGRMQPAGAKAFAARTERRTGVYSFENRPQELPPALERLFRARAKAWKFFSDQPPGYRRIAIWWVVSAKQDATRERRLSHLIAESAGGRRLDALSPGGRGKPAPR